MGGSALGSSGDNGAAVCLGERDEDGWREEVAG